MLHDRLIHCLRLSVVLLFLVPVARAQDDRPRLRVLTYNIHHGEAMDGKFDYERLAGVIKSLHPDIVALQEVDRGTERASGVDQAALLEELTGMKSVFGSALVYQGGEYGEALLSRWPLDQIRTYHLPFEPQQEPRTALAARITPDNGLPRFVFVGTHLDHTEEATRLEQTQRLNRVLPAAGGPPILLAGDLNARPGSAPMEELFAERWIDAIAPQSRIDYVLFRNGDPWKVVEVQIVDETVVSDHRPVLAILEWTGKTEPARRDEKKGAGLHNSSTRLIDSWPVGFPSDHRLIRSVFELR